MLNCACISLSGGQGKTTTTWFLSRLLAAQGVRVLAIDADPQANLTFYLDHEVEPDQSTLLEVIRGDIPIKQGIYRTKWDGLSLIPASLTLLNVSEYLSRSGAGAFVLKNRLSLLKDDFDYVIIDVQPTRSQLCLSVVGAVDKVIIPVESTSKGLNSLIDTIDFLREQASFMAFNGEIAGCLPFRDRWIGRSQSRESKDTIAAIIELSEEIPVFPSIRESEHFKRALRTGQTLSQIGVPHLEKPFADILKAIML